MVEKQEKAARSWTNIEGLVEVRLSFLDESMTFSKTRTSFRTQESFYCFASLEILIRSLLQSCLVVHCCSVK